ncbi:alkaline phosphatase family protein [Desulfovibrio ferrophilus]|uniref:Type I phosphodiesterase/nucleotide pyrophosphatase n=1 Tax=Desulfovibrio ferrophilus TaxID=241368 RepID=A0A2Z6B3C6_9BACT|nr:alkaline phosphatase family protein [Desulfovibrio ferrophilus]BBD09991.1 type I phosphodiesterase/nucleotide pyrophosphatase [Desulfovibrio ferrophilus]
MTYNQRPRLAVLGLDGLPLSLARDWCRRGLTPNLARIAMTDEARSMRSELPELSPVNWTSFATGAGPEEHGVFGFTRIDPHTYEVAIADSSAVRCPTILQRLSAQGLTSKVINLPNTYPAHPLKGMLIAGFVAPELSRAVYPPFLSGPLTQAGYQLEADTARGKDDPDLLLTELRTTLHSRHTALNMLWPDLAWDLFVFVLTETDRLFHFHYPALSDPTHPLAPACENFIRKWDALIGEFLNMYEALPDPKRLIALADHGFTELITEVDLNTWLTEQGLLRLTGTHDHENDARAIASDSAAFALDPGRIYLHTRERFSRGGVTPTEVPGLLDRIRKGLMSLTFEGRPVIRTVHEREILYPGPMAGIAPELVAEPHPGFSLTAKFDSRSLFGFHGRHGVHCADDVFFYDSNGAAPRRLRDTGRLVLDFFDFPKQD